MDNQREAKVEGAARQKIVVFQQKGSGKLKIEGVRRFGGNTIELEIYDIDDVLPDIIDDTSEYLPADLQCDLVLDYLKHSDLSTDLAALCASKNIPVVASGKKTAGKNIFTPPTCCGLPHSDVLGNYCVEFGAPEFSVEVVDGKVSKVDVLRGAPCGATWEVVKRLIGHPVEDAARKIGLETQFFCVADPSGWDPIYGKSPVHFAGKVHDKQLQKAIAKIALCTDTKEEDSDPVA